MSGLAGSDVDHELDDAYRVTAPGKRAISASLSVPGRPALCGIPERVLFDQYAVQASIAKIRLMTREMLEVVTDLRRARQIDAIAVEVSSGKAGTGSKAGASSSLGVYGMMAGAVWMVLDQHHPVDVVPVNERQHIRRGMGTKEKRMLALKYACPRYQIEKDSGGDVADAASVASWMISRWRDVAEKNR